MLTKTIRVLVLSAAGCGAGLTQAAPEFVASSLSFDEIVDHYRAADFNGDGRGDLVVNLQGGERGRELLVFMQGSDGRFSTDDFKRIELKSDIIAYSIADVRDDPGAELIFFSRSGAFSFSTKQTSYAGNIQPLLQWDFINTVPNDNRIPFLEQVEDYNGDGRVDMLLPGKDGYALFIGQADGSFKKQLQLPKPFVHPEENRTRPGMSFSPENGLEFNIELVSPFDGVFIDPAQNNNNAEQKVTSRRTREGNDILDFERWVASAYPAHINQDELSDFVYIDDFVELKDERKKLNIVLQHKDGKSAVSALDVADRSLIKLVDFNGDGLSDLYTLERDGADQATYFFIQNVNGKLDPEKPVQVMRFSGFDVDAELIDLDTDGKPELIVSYYSISTVDAIRNGNMLRTTLIYKNTGSETGEVFGRRPDFKLEEKYSAGAFKGLVQRIDFMADVDGDGKKDAVSINNDGALVSYKIDSNYSINSSPFWQFTPLHIIGRFTPVTFNDDNASDFVLQHQRSLTTLVTRP